MRVRRRFGAAALALSLVLVGAACGDDEETSATTEEDGGNNDEAGNDDRANNNRSNRNNDEDEEANEDDRLTEDEFIEEANSICAEGNEEIEAAQEDLPEEPSPEQVEEFISDELIPNTEDQLDALGELTPPEDIEEDFEQLLADAEEALESIRGLSGEELLELDDPFADVSRQAEELGLDECAS